MKIPGLNNASQRIHVFIVCLLIAPLCFMVLPKKWDPKLKGSFTKAHASDFTLDRWWSGYFQDEFEDWINDHIGLRAWFVKANYQYDYSLFDTTHTRSVIRGKEHYFYETNYINAHLGLDFLGRDSIQGKVDSLLKIRNYLKESNSELLVILAPGKGSFYPEYFPESYDTIDPNPENNYSVYQQYLKESGIPTLDFHKWFLDMKDTTSHALFPNTGIHWSRYGSLIAADSILRYLEGICQKPFPELTISDFHKSTNTAYSDDDLELSLNLLFDLPHLEMTYPEYSFSEMPKTDRTKVLTIADSYYWDMYNFKLSESGYQGGEFWYYNQLVYPASSKGHVFVDSARLQNIHKNRVVVIMSTDANLYKFPFGFDDKVLPVINEIVRQRPIKRLQAYMQRIYHTPPWIAKLRIEAERKGLDLDSLVRENAKYSIWKEDNPD